MSIVPFIPSRVYKPQLQVFATELFPPALRRAVTLAPKYQVGRDSHTVLLRRLHPRHDLTWPAIGLKCWTALPIEPKLSLRRPVAFRNYHFTPLCAHHTK